jgi:hypothetical protein
MKGKAVLRSRFVAMTTADQQLVGGKFVTSSSSSRSISIFLNRKRLNK